MFKATFFLSSGRCGTQWLHENLKSSFKELAVVKHEPIFDDYFPRKMLSYNDSKKFPPTSKLKNHADWVESILKNQNYIECGWLCYSSIPYLKKRFETQLKIVHLTRHPIYSASSMMTHRYYSLDRTEDNLNDKALITPFDDGTVFNCYQTNWSKFTLFQKCLYLWGEIHSLGLQFELDYKEAYFRTSFEEIFEEKKIERLLSFLELPQSASIKNSLKIPVDNFNRQTSKAWKIEEITQLPEIIKLAKQLNYSINMQNFGDIKKRYKKPRQHLQTAGYHIAASGTKLQEHFNVAVIMPTTLRSTLGRALKSVYNQDFGGRIQILIGIDKSTSNRDALKNLCSTQPPHCMTTIVDLGYSTSVKHGGLRLAKDGGSLRTVLSYIANSRYLAYLDDDNWWSRNHLSSLVKTIDGSDWSYSLRWFVDPVSNKPQCIDQWESTGVNSGVFKRNFGGWVDPNCLLIDSIKCEPVFRLWSTPILGDKKGMSADRKVFSALHKNFKYASTNLASCYYVINPNDGMHNQRIHWINKVKRAKGN